MILKYQILFLFLGIFFFICALFANLAWTHKELLKKSIINHKKDWLIKALSSMPGVVLFSLASGNISSLTLRVLLSSSLVATWFWLLFSGIYGWKVARDFFFQGTADASHKAISDKIPRGLSIFLKLASVTITTYLYVHLFSR